MKKAGKSERALKLSEQGLTVAQIAERIGSPPNSTRSLILHAKLRREKEAARLASDVREIVAEMEGQEI